MNSNHVSNNNRAIRIVGGTCTAVNNYRAEITTDKRCTIWPTKEARPGQGRAGQARRNLHKNAAASRSGRQTAHPGPHSSSPNGWPIVVVVVVVVVGGGGGGGVV